MIKNQLTSELLQIKELVCDTCNLELSNLVVDSESQEYQACSFKLNLFQIIHALQKSHQSKLGSL